MSPERRDALIEEFGNYEQTIRDIRRKHRKAAEAEVAAFRLTSKFSVTAAERREIATKGYELLGWS